MREVFPLTGAERSTRDIKRLEKPSLPIPTFQAGSALCSHSWMCPPFPFPFPFSGMEMFSIPIPICQAGSASYSHPHSHSHPHPHSHSHSHSLPPPNKIIPIKSFEPRIFSSCFFFSSQQEAWSRSRVCSMQTKSSGSILTTSLSQSSLSLHGISQIFLP